MSPRGTTLHTFKTPDDDLWQRAMAVAKARGENLSQHVIRPALLRYVRRHEVMPPPPSD